jgi:L-fuconate dehydratase
VDHLHEHFIEPVVIRNGRYMPPARPGYTIEMHADSLARFEFPGGAGWKE